MPQHCATARRPRAGRLRRRGPRDECPLLDAEAGRTFFAAWLVASGDTNPQTDPILAREKLGCLLTAAEREGGDRARGFQKEGFPVHSEGSDHPQRLLGSGEAGVGHSLRQRAWIEALAVFGPYRGASGFEIYFDMIDAIQAP